MVLNKIKIKKLKRKKKNYIACKIEIKNNHLYNLLKRYPKIASGRKNFKLKYLDLLKNILLTEIYIEAKKLQKKEINDICFYRKNNFLYVKGTISAIV